MQATFVRHRGAFLAIGVVFVVLGCGPPGAEGAKTFLVYDRNAGDGGYELVESRIETLDDVESIRGETAKLRGGGSIQLRESNPQTAEEFENALAVADSKSPVADYDIRGDGVVVPGDFHSAMMFTLYHHLERARAFFIAAGVSEAALGSVPVHYYARIQIIVPVDILSDNAAYAFTLDAFLIPPSFALDDVPLSANRGVVVHEYAHLVFNRLVEEDARAPEYLIEPWPAPAINRLSALNEGIADIFAALETGDPNFIDASISDELFDVDRDLSKDRQLDDDLLADVRESGRAGFNPYELGTVIASTVWELEALTDDDRLTRSLVETLRDFAGTEADFSIADFFNRLHAHLPAEIRDRACEIFESRLVAIREELSCGT